MQNDGGNWSAERIDLIKRSICPKGINTDEFLLFIEQCKRSGLDPLLKEAFCVPRNVRTGTDPRSNKPTYGTKHEFQPSEAGMLARALRFPDYQGISAAEVYADDNPSIDYGKGEVHHVVNPAKRTGALVGAWARVQLKDRVPVVVWVDFAAYVQSTPLWSKLPATMVRKCARVAALRIAYPAEFGGLYVAGERPDDVDTGEDEAQEQPAQPLRRPELPAPAPREELTFTTRETEKVPVGSEFARSDVSASLREPWPGEQEPPREPGADDGDPVEDESLAIVHACETVTDPGEFARLVTRAKALPNKTEAKKRAGAAINRAAVRLGVTPKASGGGQ